MKHEEGNFTGIRETKIYYQSWLPENEKKGTVIIVHGFGEHSGRYMNVVDKLVGQDIAVHAIDHRGHGKSGGPVNYVSRFTDYFEDLTIFESKVMEKLDDKPLFMLGHSMGSLIAAHYIARNPKQDIYSSLILSGTGADFGPGINAMTRFLAKVLSFIIPKLSIPSNLDPNFISHDEEVVETYVNDPLVHFKMITARLGSEMMKYTGSMEEAAAGIHIPTLIQIGSEDETFAPESREVLRDAIANDDKKLIVYDGYRHEVYNEVGKEKVLEDLVEWLQKFV